MSDNVTVIVTDIICGIHDNTLRDKEKQWKKLDVTWL